MTSQWTVSILCFLSAFVLFWRLGHASLHDWDEAIYAQISREMTQRHDWLTPYWNNQPWFDKPPLYMWCTAVLFQLFGITEFTARAVSALAATAVLGLTYQIGGTLYHRRVAVLAVAISVTSFQVVHSARSGMTDMMLTLFIYLSLWACLQLRKGAGRWWYVIGLSCGLAIMTKGSAGFAAPAIVILTLGLDGTLTRAGQTKYVLRGLGLCLLVCLPWHIFMMARHGTAFVQDYLGTHGTVLVTHGIDQQTGGTMYYVDRLRYLFFPWVYLLPFALALSLRENLGRLTRSRVLIGNLALLFAAYTAVHTKIGWYILPLYPIMAILTASLIDQSLDASDTFAFSSLVVGSAVVVLGSTGKALLVLPVLGALVLVVWMQWRTRTPQAVGGALCFFLFLVGMSQVAPLYQQGRSAVQAVLGTVKQSHHGTGTPLLVVGGSIVPSALFYSGRQVVDVGTPANLATVIDDGRPRDILLAWSDLAHVPTSCTIHIRSASANLVYGIVQERRSIRARAQRYPQAL